MSEEAAFLEVLKSNPADDTARLVYADWLDEHGETLKADYLRLLVYFAQHEGNLANAREHRVFSQNGQEFTGRVARGVWLAIQPDPRRLGR